jgi:hypothetical protein
MKRAQPNVRVAARAQCGYGQLPCFGAVAWAAAAGYAGEDDAALIKVFPGIDLPHA